MAELPTFRDSWRRTLDQTDWDSAIWSGTGAVVTGLLSVIFGVADALLASAIGLGGGIVVLTGQVIAKLLRAPRAILLDRLRASERERTLAEHERDLLALQQAEMEKARPKVNLVLKEMGLFRALIVNNVGATATFRANIQVVSASCGGPNIGRSLPLHWETRGSDSATIETNGEDYFRFASLEIAGGGAMITLAAYRHDPAYLSRVEQFWHGAWLPDQDNGPAPVRALVRITITADPELLPGPCITYWQLGPWGVHRSGEPGYEFDEAGHLPDDV